MLGLITRQRLSALWFAARINVYGIALNAMWTPLNAVLLQVRIGEIVPE